ncbi:DBH-like monooxygenase protein 2 [Discoglossus pictus]
MAAMWQSWVLLAVLPIVGSWRDIDLELSRVMMNRVSKETAVIKWGYDRDSEEVVIELQVPGASWIALGMNYNRSMNGSDVVIGGWNEDDEDFFFDAHLEEKWPPVEDESQDYDLVELRDNGTHSFMRVWRKFFTCDPNDLDIENDTIRVTVYYGDDYDLEYSEDHTFYMSIFFFEIAQKIPMNTKVLIHELRLPNYEPILSPSTASIIHHIFVYYCSNSTIVTSDVSSECYSDSRFSQCLVVMFGFVVGGEGFYYPESAGLPIGTEDDSNYVRIEIHFSNFDLIEGLVDNSGIIMYYTPELREYDAGILMVGVFPFPVHFIPPAAQNFRTYGLCNTDLMPKVLDKQVGDLIPSAFLLHGHLTAHGLRIMHYRNGTLIGSLGEDNTYDFNFQQIRYFPHNITIKPGDQILVECKANTLDREDITFGGPGTLNEMCVGFLFYYPALPIAACWSLLDLSHVTNALQMDHFDNLVEAAVGLGSVEWNDETREIAQRAIVEANHLVMVQNLKL